VASVVNYDKNGIAMEKITWGENFSVGVRDLDAQHKQIVIMVNTLIEMNETKVDSEIISDTLTKMTQYAIEHFQKEEQYMLDYGYPEYSSQRKQHQEFKKKTVDFCMETMLHKTTVPTEIFTYLKLWWTNHILQEDMKYKKFFNDRGLR
jgi:hemerythrin